MTTSVQKFKVILWLVFKKMCPQGVKRQKIRDQLRYLPPGSDTLEAGVSVPRPQYYVTSDAPTSIWDGLIKNGGRKVEKIQLSGRLKQQVKPIVYFSHFSKATRGCGS